jgi:hypothetical protein
MKHQLLAPKTVDLEQTRADLKSSQDGQRKYFDKQAKDLLPLQVGDTV